jgi:PAS domain-containing protein
MSLKRSFHCAICDMVALGACEALDYCLEEGRAALASRQMDGANMRCKSCIVDREGRFYDANEKLVAHLKITREELMSCTVFDLFPRKIAERRMAMIRKAMDTGRTVVFMDSRNGICFETMAIPLRLGGYATYDRVLCMTSRLNSTRSNSRICLEADSTRHVWERVRAV